MHNNHLRISDACLSTGLYSRSIYDVIFQSIADLVSYNLDIISQSISARH